MIAKLSSEQATADSLEGVRETPGVTDMQDPRDITTVVANV